MVKADTLEELPSLTEEDKGTYAIVGKGCIKWMYFFIWDFKKQEGHWSFACLLEE